MEDIIGISVMAVFIAIYTYFFRKQKPVVKENGLLMKIPLSMQIFVIILFLFFSGMLILMVIDQVYVFILFPVLILFYLGQLLRQLPRTILLKEDHIYYSRLFKNRTKHVWNDLIKIDYHVSEQSLVLYFSTGKAKATYSMRGSIYFYHLLMSKFEAYLSPKAREHIFHQINIHSIPII